MFGCKGLLCWTYAGHNPECPSLITVDGRRTNAWYDALTIVNMSELEAIKTAHVKLKIAGTTVVAWPRGQRTGLNPDADGFYHLTLPSGEGVFIEVGGN